MTKLNRNTKNTIVIFGINLQLKRKKYKKNQNNFV